MAEDSDRALGKAKNILNRNDFEQLAGAPPKVISFVGQKLLEEIL
jgi:hypothetical protein